MEWSTAVSYPLQPPHGGSPSWSSLHLRPITQRPSPSSSSTAATEKGRRAPLSRELRRDGSGLGPSNGPRWLSGFFARIMARLSSWLDQNETIAVIRHPNDCFTSLGIGMTQKRKFRDHRCTLLYFFLSSFLLPLHFSFFLCTHRTSSQQSMAAGAELALTRTAAAGQGPLA